MKLLLLLLMVFNSTAFALCDHQDLGRLPILASGRIKPLAVHTSETLKFLSTKKSYKKFGHLKTYCLLSSQEKSEIDLKLRIDHEAIREKLELSPPFILSFNDLDQYTQDLRFLMMKDKFSTPLKKEVQAFQRFYIAGGQPVEAGSQGRVLIPKSLREYANLKDQIVIVGMGSKMEIWNMEDWQKIFNNLATDFEDTLNVIANLDMGVGHA